MYIRVFSFFFRTDGPGSDGTDRTDWQERTERTGHADGRAGPDGRTDRRNPEGGAPPGGAGPPLPPYTLPGTRTLIASCASY